MNQKSVHDLEQRTFTGRTMSDALTKVKSELGTDAVILHTRNVERGGASGGRPVVEITAARIPPTSGVNGTRVALRLDGARKKTVSESQVLLRASECSRQSDADRSDANPVQHIEPNAAMWREIQAIRDMVQSVLENRDRAGRGPSHIREETPAMPPGHDETPVALVDYYTRLVRQCVSDELAREIIRQAQCGLESTTTTELPAASARGKSRLKGQRGMTNAVPRVATARAEVAHMASAHIDPARVEEELVRTIETFLPPMAPIELNEIGRPSVVAFVGPTGVGKTTTLAKLAATIKLRQGRRVGVVTLDTYRIAAVEQLRTYATILHVPMAVVRAPEEMRAVIDGLGNLDVVLIDTMGCNPRDPSGLDELASFLGAAEADQVHLVLSGVTDEAANRAAVAAFARVGTSHVIMTKLDEAAGFGVLLNVLRDVKLRLSYLTSGQSVPEDIEACSRRTVARVLLGLDPPTWKANPAGAGDVPPPGPPPG